MPLIKVIRHGQVTLPAKFRKALNVKEGDYLEADLKRDQIVLKPKVILDRAEAINRLNRLLDEVHAQNEDIPEEEVERDVLEAIQAIRQQEYARKPKHAQRRNKGRA